VLLFAYTWRIPILRQITALGGEECEMENINGTSPASFRWIFLSAAMGLAASARLCFAQADQNASHERAIVLSTVIAAVSAVVAVIGAVIASRSARALMKSAYTKLGAQKKHGGMLPPPITITANKKIDWATHFIGAIDAPFSTVLTILFSIALGVGLNLLLSRSDSPGALVPSKPAVRASAASVSAPPPSPATAASVFQPPPQTSTAAATASAAPISVPPRPTSAAAATASASPVSAPPRPTSAAAASDPNEAAALLERGRASLSHGDVALARVFLRRAAERDDPQAALALGGTYDPAELKRIGVPNFQAQADPVKARAWYRRATELGSAAAALRLQRLP
jgi:hypothetical protein